MGNGSYKENVEIIKQIITNSDIEAKKEYLSAFTDEEIAQLYRERFELTQDQKDCDHDWEDTGNG